jgi:hypothetical protein
MLLPRFRLRTLMVAVAVVGLTLGAGLAVYRLIDSYALVVTGGLSRPLSPSARKNLYPKIESDPRPND